MDVQDELAGFRAIFQPQVPVPDSPPRLLDMFRSPTPACLRGIPSINSIATPANPRGAFFGKIGPNLCNLSLTGILGDHPPTEPEGFLEFVRSLPVPSIYEIVRKAAPRMDPVRFTFPASVRRHYEQLTRFPKGLLVMGDAVCSVNPVYGQGMSVAALESQILRRHLRRSNAAPEAGAFFADVSTVLDASWEISAGGDLAFPGVEGRRTFTVHLGNAHMARLQRAARRDATVTEGFMRVVGLLDPPSALMSPRMVARVLWQGRSAGRSVPANDAALDSAAPPAVVEPKAA